MADDTALAPEAKGPWDDLLCTLPDCDAPLYIERTTSLRLIAGQTIAEARTGEDVSSWQVSCQEGHVLLLSGDDEYAQFGLCRWDDADHDEPHDCPRLDLEQLRKVSRVGPHEHIRAGEVCRDCGDPIPPRGES